MKTIIFGIDAATFTLIEPWIKDGKLKYLARLMEDGASGVLDSAMPPLSPVAWPSFFTGVNPGKHGIFDFVVPESTDGGTPCTDGGTPYTNGGIPYANGGIPYANSRRRPTPRHAAGGTSLPGNIRFNNLTNCGVPAFWELFSQLGLTVGALNIPMTYPPYAFPDDSSESFMVSGLGTPNVDSKFTWPPELKDKILQKTLGKYAVEINNSLAERPGKYRDALIELVQTRKETALFLLDKYTPDVFTVVFTATDRAQHGLWKFMDTRSPDYSPGYESAILEVYEEVDKAIGEIMEKAGDNYPNVIVMSDHGMELVTTSVDINKWLMINGFQSWKDIPLIHRLKTKGQRIYNGLKRRIFKNGKIIIGANSQIDWQRTKAYHLGSWGNIYINVKRDGVPYGTVQPGIEYEKVRNEIIVALKGLVDPASGNRVIKDVLRKENVYTGDYMVNAPDLVIIWKENYTCVKSILEKSGKKHKVYGIDSVFEKPRGISADHNFDGIFIIKSPYNIAGKRNLKANIIDICPTLFYVHDLEIPAHMDGKVIAEAFNSEFLEKRPIKSQNNANDKDDQTNSAGPSRVDGSYTDKNIQDVASKLKDLGYL